MEVLSDLEAALHLTDDSSAAAPLTTSAPSSNTTVASSVASNNNSSSSVNSSSNLNSNTIVTQAVVSSPSRSVAAPLDGVYTPNSQIDDVSVIVKQPVSGGDGTSSLFNNNNDVSAKDRTHVTAVVGTPPI